MSKSTAIKITAFAAVVATGIALYSRSPEAPPPTGALTHSDPSDNPRYVPEATPKPALEIGEKTKLFMNDSDYLFGSQKSPESAALSDRKSYRFGFGREIENASGSTLTGEVSFNMGEESSGSADKEPQTRLSAAYLRQLNKNSDFRAGLSTDIAESENWSTLELQFSVQLNDSLSLKLNQEYGRSLDNDEREHQTGIAVEKNF